MAHRISNASGRDEIAYTGEQPWHALGTRVEGLQTPAAMLTAAGMDWTVSTQPLYRRVGESYLKSENRVALVRDDVGLELGTASPRYQPIQNSQNAEIMEALITEGGAYVEVAGALDQGARCWMLAQLPGSFEVVAGDRIRPYCLLCWGHDGNHGVAGKLTFTRVVCHNTLTAAGFGDGKKWSAVADVYLRHYGQTSLRIDEARKALGLLDKRTASTAEAYQALAACTLADGDAAEYFASVIPQPGEPAADDAEARASYEDRLARWTAVQERIARLYTTDGLGLDVPGVRGTAWAAYNAVTEWIDHVYPVLQNGSVSAHRQQSVLFGSYGATRQQALLSALELATPAK